jgi:hypothetical protein
MTNRPNHFGRVRVARLLFCASAVGEIGVGVLVLLFPQLLAVLMRAPLGPSELLVARMLGSAVLALGVTWWIGRNHTLLDLTSRYLAGYLIYNLGMGILFVYCALTAGESALPWVVAIAHLLMGVGFPVTVLTEGAAGSEAAPD